MTEWGVVLVISALLGLFVVVAKPVVSLTQAITKLTATVESIKADFDSMSLKNTESHRRIWDHNDEQDKQIMDHDRRITRLEGQE